MPQKAIEKPILSKCRSLRARNLRVGAALILGVLVLGTSLSLVAHAEIMAKSSLTTMPNKAVNVTVSQSIQLPLSDLSEKVIAQQQESGRRLFYRQAQSECKVLLETIAASCRISRISVSSRIQEGNNRRPTKLYLNGNANYLITLKEKTPE